MLFRSFGVTQLKFEDIDSGHDCERIFRGRILSLCVRYWNPAHILRRVDELSGRNRSLSIQCPRPVSLADATSLTSCTESPCRDFFKSPDEAQQINSLENYRRLECDKWISQRYVHANISMFNHFFGSSFFSSGLASGSLN